MKRRHFKEYLFHSLPPFPKHDKLKDLLLSDVNLVLLSLSVSFYLPPTPTLHL